MLSGLRRIINLFSEKQDEISVGVQNKGFLSRNRISGMPLVLLDIRTKGLKCRKVKATLVEGSAAYQL